MKASKILMLILVTLCCLLKAKSQTKSQQNALIALPSFHTINTRGNVHLIVVPSDTTSALSLDFMGLKPKHFKYKVKNGILYIDVKSGLLLKNRFLRIVATTPQLNAIISQDANVEFLGTMVTDAFVYRSCGGKNNAHLMLDVQDLDIDILGHADLSVEGQSIRAKMNASAGSRINALALGVDTLNARASDGSEIYALPSQKLVAKAHSWGTIYYGPEVSIQPHITTGGNVVLIQRASVAQRFAEYLGVSADEVLKDINQNSPAKMPDREINTQNNQRKETQEEETPEDFF